MLKWSVVEVVVDVVVDVEVVVVVDMKRLLYVVFVMEVFVNVDVAGWCCGC